MPATALYKSSCLIVLAKLTFCDQMWCCISLCIRVFHVTSSVPARSEIDHEIIITAILLPSAYSRRVVVSYKRKYVHEVLVNPLVKLSQKKNVIRRTDLPYMTIAVDWDVKHRTKQSM